jgi:hypothetical protein
MEKLKEKYPGVVVLPMAEYRYPIYVEWDKSGYKCPHNSNGWVAWYNNLVDKNK